MKINVVKFLNASPIYGVSSIRVGASNVMSIELDPKLAAVQVTRHTGQKLLHPLSVIEYIDFSDDEVPAPAPTKKAAKE
jgi:hypothetical protein